MESFLYLLENAIELSLDDSLQAGPSSTLPIVKVDRTTNGLRLGPIHSRRLGELHLQFIGKSTH